jgi:hypothetical protein
MELLFGKLLEFIANEDELRALWSEPEMRKSSPPRDANPHRRRKQRPL